MRTKKLKLNEYCPTVFSIQEQIQKQVQKEDWLLEHDVPIPELPSYVRQKVEIKNRVGFRNLIKTLLP